jgi:hypothetical protein
VDQLAAVAADFELDDAVDLPDSEGFESVLDDVDSPPEPALSVDPRVEPLTELMAPLASARLSVR